MPKQKYRRRLRHLQHPYLLRHGRKVARRFLALRRLAPSPPAPSPPSPHPAAALPPAASPVPPSAPAPARPHPHPFAKYQDVGGFGAVRPAGEAGNSSPFSKYQGLGGGFGGTRAVSSASVFRRVAAPSRPLLPGTRALSDFLRGEDGGRRLSAPSDALPRYTGGFAAVSSGTTVYKESPREAPSPAIPPPPRVAPTGTEGNPIWLIDSDDEDEEYMTPRQQRLQARYDHIYNPPAPASAPISAPAPAPPSPPVPEPVPESLYNYIPYAARRFTTDNMQKAIERVCFRFARTHLPAANPWKCADEVELNGSEFKDFFVKHRHHLPLRWCTDLNTKTELEDAVEPAIGLRNATIHRNKVGGSFRRRSGRGGSQNDLLVAVSRCLPWAELLGDNGLIGKVKGIVAFILGLGEELERDFLAIRRNVLRSAGDEEEWDDEEEVLRKAGVRLADAVKRIFAEEQELLI